MVFAELACCKHQRDGGATVDLPEAALGIGHKARLEYIASLPAACQAGTRRSRPALVTSADAKRVPTAKRLRWWALAAAFMVSRGLWLAKGLWRLGGRHYYPKPNHATAAVLSAPVAGGRLAAPGMAPRAATHNTDAASCGALRVSNCVGFVFAVPILAPLPDIAVHIVEAKPI